MFKPQAIYYEKAIENYELGKELLQKYKDVPKIVIENHNNIEEMRKKENKEFLKMKTNLIIGVRKTHKFVENHKVSDYFDVFADLLSRLRYKEFKLSTGEWIITQKGQKSDLLALLSFFLYIQ